MKSLSSQSSRSRERRQIMQTEKEIHRLYMMISAKGKKNYSRIKEIGHAGVQECLILGR